MKTDILGLIREQKDVTNVLVLTHNIDFVFVQNLLIDALRACGAPSLTIFADAQCAATSFALQAPLLSNLGRRYRVVPVPSAAGFRFHPKACLLSGRTRALLLIGSGNLTFGGWRENAEIWASFDSRDGTAEINAFRQYIVELTEGLPLNAAPMREVQESFDPQLREWAGSLEQPAGLMGRLGSGRRLLDPMVEALGGPGGDRLTVCSPYFDEDGDALTDVVAAVGARETLVLADSNGSNLRPKALAALPSSVAVRGASVRRAENEHQRDAFLHAKFYAVERGLEVLLLLGSANCSRAALTIPGLRGNSELMAVRRLSLEEFRAEILDEITISEGPPSLTVAADVESSEISFAPQLIAARTEGGLLQLAYRAPAGWHVTHAVLDNDAQPVRRRDLQTCECIAPEGARVVRLRGQLGQQEVETPPLWIDREDALASTGYRRSLEREIRGRAFAGAWGGDDWANVLNAFCQDLQYIRRRPTQVHESKTADGETGHEVFNRADIFSADLSAALGGYQARTTGLSQAASLHSLLTRWFAGENEVQQDAENIRRDQRARTGTLPGFENEEVVDQPEEIVPTDQDPEEIERTQRRMDRERKRGVKLIEQVASSMSSAGFISIRHPLDLARDLKLASVLLRMGVHKRWLEREDFLAATFRIWSALFLTEPDERPSALRSDNNEDGPNAQLSSPAVAAALFAWATEIPDSASTPREAQLVLALALSVSRYPWVWIADDRETMVADLAGLLRATGEELEVAQIQEKWRALMSAGEALQRFETSLQAVDFTQLRLGNRADLVEPGELAFQGRFGYAIVQEATQRSANQNVRLLLLRASESGEVLIRGGFVNPIRGLMENPELRERLVGNEESSLAIQVLLSRVRGAWRSAPPHS